MASDRSFLVDADLDGLSLASALKRLLPDRTWSQVKQLIAKRRICVNRALCLDEGRRLRAGDEVELFAQSRKSVPSECDVRIVHRDEHLVVVDKPAGIVTVRRPEERDWPEERKARQPTLDEVVLAILQRETPRRRPGRSGRIRVRAVHRLDRDTSGLMLFALTPATREALVGMFGRREVKRTYLAVVHGHPPAQTVETWLARDRGDGVRGSVAPGARDPQSRQAITHLKPVRRVGGFSVVECRLDTGRTHQIRIHLCEIGHRVCGEKVYTHRPGEPPAPDASGAPRQALHSTELAFVHPATGAAMRFTSPLPRELEGWLRHVGQD